MPDSPCVAPEARQLDFWLGEWSLSWPAEQTGGEAGATMQGTNRISQLFGRCAIEENFATADGEFQGHSVSVYDERASTWRQTWVDSSGSYLWFTGGMDNGEMILSTEPVVTDGTTSVSRMVFTDITSDSLLWRWQKSVDGGATWSNVWTIWYRRAD